MNQTNTPTLQTYTGSGIEPFIPELARLRTKVFREYPYLYDGTPEYEEKYLRTYSASPESLFVVVRDGERVVGVSTGVPLRDADPPFQKPFRDAGHDLRGIFYLGESVLHPVYRGRGLGRRFFKEREGYARERGYTLTTFCAVERSPEDARRPTAYHPLDEFWKRLGYEKRADLQTTYAWKEVGREEETDHLMLFWVKRSGS